MDLSAYQKINNIVERDSADATYKYALLRGVIEVCQQYGHLRQDDIESNRVWFPLGLLVEKWILYYYPIFAAPAFIPQKNGERPDTEPGKKVAFRKYFTPIIDFYQDRGGFSVFYNDYSRGLIPGEIQPAFRKLAVEIRNTIVNYPMKHLGFSQSKRHYSIISNPKPLPRLPSHGTIDRGYLIEHGGSFSIASDLSTIFEYFGSFISGDECILKKWAAFTASADKTKTITEEAMLFLLGTTPTTERALADARAIYSSVIDREASIRCAWSGKAISSSGAMHVDHLLPFSIWKNNDLWNLLPATGSVNNQKRDRIPDSQFLRSRKEPIIGYWDLLHDHWPHRFEREIEVSLLGMDALGGDWPDHAFDQLSEKCDYLINIRGYQPWSI